MLNIKKSTSCEIEEFEICVLDLRKDAYEKKRKKKKREKKCERLWKEEKRIKGLKSELKKKMKC